MENLKNLNLMYFEEWKELLDTELFNKILYKVNQVSSISTPLINQIFEPFRKCSYKNLQLVMLGDGPYVHKNEATGLLFGNYKNTPDLSPPLKKLKECAINFEIPHNCINFDPSLENWANQGILLLCTSLTAIIGRKDSHFNLWFPYIAYLLTEISRNKCLTYILFGNRAKQYKPYINPVSSKIIEVNNPEKWVKLPYNLFTDINKHRKNNLEKQFNWYEKI